MTPLSLLQMIFTCLSMLFACTNLLPFPLSRKAYACIFTHLIIMYLVSIPLRQYSTILCIAGVQLIIYLFSRRHIMNCSFSLLGYLISICINHLFTIPLSLIGISISELVQYHAVSWTIFYCAVVFAVTYPLGRYLRRNFFHKLPPIPNSLEYLLFMEILLCTCIYVLNIINGEHLGYTTQVIILNGVLFFIFFILTGIIFFFAIQVIKKETKANMLLKQYENLQAYTERVENLYQGIRLFKHDYLNILSSLSSLIEEEDLPALKEYFHRNIAPTAQDFEQKDAVLTRLGNMKVPELKGLLSAKIISAMGQGIDVSLEIKDVVEKLPIPDMELTKLLGIFLDNAIESALETESKKLSIALMHIDSYLLIQIQNSCIQDTMSIDGLSLAGFSTKGPGRGIGLTAAQNIINQYDNIIHTTGCIHHTFNQTLQLYQKEE